MTAQDVVADMHSIHPEYVKASLQLSLQRMRIETVSETSLHGACCERAGLSDSQGLFMDQVGAGAVRKMHTCTTVPPVPHTTSCGELL